MQYGFVFHWQLNAAKKGLLSHSFEGKVLFLCWGLFYSPFLVLFGDNFKFLLSHKARCNCIWLKDNDGIACLIDIKCGCGIDGGKSALVSSKIGKGVICCCPFLHLLLDAGVGNGNVVVAQDILQGNLVIGL